MSRKESGRSAMLEMYLGYADMLYKTGLIRNRFSALDTEIRCFRNCNEEILLLQFQTTCEELSTKEERRGRLRVSRRIFFDISLYVQTTSMENTLYTLRLILCTSVTVEDFLDCIYLFFMIVMS